MDLLLEQMAISKQQRFRRSTEKIDWEGQFRMLFNEAEVIIVDRLMVYRICNAVPAKGCPFLVAEVFISLSNRL